MASQNDNLATVNSSTNRSVDNVSQMGKNSSDYKIVLVFILSLFFITCTKVVNLSTQKPISKTELTPVFWQRDPDANFEDEGRQHCAPTAVSDGLIYLAKTFNMTDLVSGTQSKKDQINLIKELAEDFQTDPSVGGTNPDKILTGLQSYMKRKGYKLNRLELMSWRPVSNSNKRFKIGTKPDISWMRNAVLSNDTVVIFNFGWYHKGENGYSRKGGHWVIAVDANSNSNEFLVNNPLLTTSEQVKKKSIVLTQLNKDFNVIDTGVQSVDEYNMIGYYDGKGSGLPRRDNVDGAILDAVIVFSIKK